jgi:hypothetical protein
VNSYRRTIKIIRTDNELFKTGNITDFLHNHTQGRIEIQSCAPYEHGQLGRVERSHRTFQDTTNKALYGKDHLSSRYFGMAYMDAVFKYNHLPRRSLNFKTPEYLWSNKKLDLLTTPFLPFGSVVMAHRPLDLQTGLSGRSFITYSVGCAPGYKGGILLFNPSTKRYIVRRTFKVMGPTMPNTYQFPIQFEAVDTYTDDSESPDPEDNQSPADAQDMALLRQEKRGSLKTSPQRVPDSLQTLPKTTNNQPLHPPTVIPVVPVVPVVPPDIPVASSNRSRTRKTKPGDSLAKIPHAPSSALSVSTYRSQLPTLMDRLLDQSVTVKKFSEQVDSYIKQLPAKLHKPLQKRAQIVSQALYKKPEPKQLYCYQAKTRVSRPLNPSVVLQDVVFRIPRSMSDAESSPERDRWKEAKDKECNSFKERQTYISSLQSRSHKFRKT